MPGSRVIVLKFGGSVLTSERAVEDAVTEIQRWRARGHQVVAVVSAIHGDTERLLRAASNFGPNVSPWSVAALAAIGELRSAALLGLALGRAELRHRVLDAGAIALRAAGDPLDADPVDVDQRVLLDALKDEDIVVVPGYVARDDRDRTVLLGRGGSDLTAIVLAGALPGAQCRLIKDVPGIYEWDPAAPGPRPRRYVTMPWSSAHGIDGSVLQHKAVRYAERSNLVIEVASLGDDDVTSIGPWPQSFEKAQETTAA
jgi:homoserine dehydrogenase